MHEGAKEVAENESAFRRANDRVAARAREDTDTDYLCECADPGCRSMIDLTPEQYRELRSHPHRFALTHGHEIDGLDVIVERHRRYLVVEKRGEGARVVEASTAERPPG